MSKNCSINWCIAAVVCLAYLASISEGNTGSAERMF